MQETPYNGINAGPIVYDELRTLSPELIENAKHTEALRTLEASGITVNDETVEMLMKSIEQMEADGVNITVADLARTMAVMTGRPVNECAAAVKQGIMNLHATKAAELKAVTQAPPKALTSNLADAIGGLEQALGVEAGSLAPVNSKPVQMPVGHFNRKARRQAKKRSGGFRKR